MLRGVAFLALVFVAFASARTVTFQGQPSDTSNATSWFNGQLMNATLASLQPGDIFVIPNKTYTVMGGIQSFNLNSVIFQLDGTLSFSTDMKEWPRQAGGRVLECIHFFNPINVTFTSSGIGTLLGNGATWWGIPGVGYLEIGENRPRLMNIENSKDILVENFFFHQSPYWTFWAPNADGLEIRFSSIDNRRLSPTVDPGHNLIDMTAFNTDGFDVTGNNVWIHDVSVWNQDDCIAVKDGSQNMVIERVTASGLGLSIGSIGDSTVRNITFRDCYMKNTVKGIYTKFRSGTTGVIEDVLYENIEIVTPSQWGIWIGPAQQSDSSDLCAAHPCSLCWPSMPGSQCGAPLSSYINITLRNVTVISPKQSPGVILGNSSNPIRGLVFEDVVVVNPGKSPFNGNYDCKGVQGGVALGTTNPVPPCFEDQTTRSREKQQFA